MTHRYRAFVRISLAAAAIASCEPLPGPTGPHFETAAKVQTMMVDDPEEELFGGVFQNGSKSNSIFYVKLVPADDSTRARLNYGNGSFPYDSLMWVDTAKTTSNMFGWFDPAADDGVCGQDRDHWSSSYRGPEVHFSAPGTLSGNSVESHCVRPGKYIITLFANSVGGQVVRALELDYLPAATTSGLSPIQISNDSVTAWPFYEQREPVPSEYASRYYTHRDLVVHFDVTLCGGSCQTPTSRFDVDVVSSGTLNNAFAHGGVPSGTASNFFRFSTANLYSGWN
jgi:hypothetical protein